MPLLAREQVVAIQIAQRGDVGSTVHTVRGFPMYKQRRLGRCVKVKEKQDCFQRPGQGTVREREQL